MGVDGRYSHLHAASPPVKQYSLHMYFMSDSPITILINNVPNKHKGDGPSKCLHCPWLGLMELPVYVGARKQHRKIYRVSKEPFGLHA